MDKMTRCSAELGEKRAQQIVGAVSSAAFNISKKSRLERMGRDREMGRFTGVPQLTQFRGMVSQEEAKDGIINQDTPDSIRNLVLEACNVLMAEDMEGLTSDQNRAHTLNIWVRRRADLLKDLGEVLHEFGFESKEYWGKGSREKLVVGNLYSVPARITKYWKNFNGIIHAIFRGFTEIGEPYFEFDRTLLGKSDRDLLKDDVDYRGECTNPGPHEQTHMMANFQIERRLVGFTLTGEEVYEVINKRQIVAECPSPGRLYPE